MDCLCDCKYCEIIRNSHEEFVSICINADSENYLKKVDSFMDCELIELEVQTDE